MNDKEYTYDIDKYTIGVDENGEDGIGLTVAIIKNGEINFLGNCYGENARCLDLLIKENQKLKKQIDNYQKELEKADNLTQICIFNGKEESKISYRKCLNILDKKETQQKEFILYLRHLSNWYSADGVKQGMVNEILQKYKEIIGVEDEKK